MKLYLLYGKTQGIYDWFYTLNNVYRLILKKIGWINHRVTLGGLIRDFSGGV